jgi:deoxyadenosine/deoxycytidine kinase
VAGAARELLVEAYFKKGRGIWNRVQPKTEQNIDTKMATASDASAVDATAAAGGGGSSAAPTAKLQIATAANTYPCWRRTSATCDGYEQGVRELARTIASQVRTVVQHTLAPEPRNSNPRELYKSCLDRTGCWHGVLEPIAIDGCIGVGKTTFINGVADILRNKLGEYVTPKVAYHVHVIEEQVEKCEPLFSSYLKDRKTHGLEFQKWIIGNKWLQFERVLQGMHEGSEPQAQRQRHALHIVLVDRSFLSDMLIFCKGMHAEGLLTDGQWEEYIDYFNLLMCREPRLVMPRLCALLDLPTDLCMARIHLRNRDGEAAAFNEAYIRRMLRDYRELYQCDSAASPVAKGAHGARERVFIRINCAERIQNLLATFDDALVL